MDGETVEIEGIKYITVVKGSRYSDPVHFNLITSK